MSLVQNQHPSLQNYYILNHIIQIIIKKKWRNWKAIIKQVIMFHQLHSILHNSLQVNYSNKNQKNFYHHNNNLVIQKGLLLLRERVIIKLYQPQEIF